MSQIYRELTRLNTFYLNEIKMYKKHVAKLQTCDTCKFVVEEYAVRCKKCDASPTKLTYWEAITAETLEMHKKTIAKLVEDVDYSNNKIERYKDRIKLIIDKSNVTIECLSKTINVKEAEIVKLTNQYNKHNIVELNNKLYYYKCRVRDLNDALKDRAKEINNKDTVINGLDTTVEQLATISNKRFNEIKKLQSCVNSKDTVIEKLNTALKEKEGIDKTYFKLELIKQVEKVFS